MRCIPFLETAGRGTAEDRNLENLRDEVLKTISVSPYACVVRGLGFLEQAEHDRAVFVRRVAGLFGEISDNNRFSERSGVYVDEVKPTYPGGKDVTFTLGSCEPHSDESSKPVPEDIVMLWCVRPASAGGTSLVWPAPELADHIGSRPDGEDTLRALRAPEFLFGGRLRNPPRVLRAPILFGDDGIRFRLGSIEDAIEVTGRPLPAAQSRALERLVQAVHTVQPYSGELRAGDLLVMLNRRALHGRTHFTDRARLLLRTRCFNTEVSNRHFDRVEWLPS